MKENVTTKQEKLQADLTKAKEARSKIIIERDALLREAHQNITRQYEDRIHKAEVAINLAEAALLMQKNADAVNHDWEGKAVAARVITKSPYTGRITGEKTLHGVVTTYRSTVKLPRARNFKHRDLKIGEPLVFLLKEDGTVGVRFMRLNEAKWELSE